MPGKGLRHTAEIAKLRKAGLSDAQIAQRLAIGRSIVHRNLSKSRTKGRLAALLATSGLQSLKAVLESTEIVLRWLQLEKVKLIEGKSTLSAEHIGGLMRIQEKALVTAKMFLGKTISPEELRKEKQDPRLQLAKERLKQLESNALNGTPIEDAEEVEDDE